MNKYFKNFILVGDIDHHCLLCKETFQLITDIEKHIRWEKHRRNIKDQNCLPKFKKDSIFKIENNYYCKICNYVTKSLDSITSHVRDDQHKTAKNNPETIVKKPIGKYYSGNVQIDKVILKKQQWHCIVGKKCLLCAVDVKKVDNHIESQDHIVKLIQSTTKIEGDRYYRMINDDCYQCYMCKNTFSKERFGDHCKNKVCKNDKIEIKEPKEGCSYKNVIEDSGKIVGVEDKLIQTLNDFFNIDEKSNLAGCKYCTTFVAINFKDMIEHMKYKHDGKDSTGTSNKKTNSSESSEDEVVYRELADHGKRRSELSKYGKEQCIKLNFNGSKGFCSLCNRYISAHKNAFREHARGAIHKCHLELKGERKPKAHEKCNIHKIGINAANVTFSAQLGAFFVQSEFYIDVHCFNLLYRIENNPHCMKTVCLACDEIFPQGKERTHCLTANHRNIFFATKIVLKDAEFIREIRPNLFHCGVCNQTIPFWDTVLKHIQTWRHTWQKSERWVMCGAADLWRNYSSFAIRMKPNNSPQSYEKLMHLYDF